MVCGVSKNSGIMRYFCEFLILLFVFENIYGDDSSPVVETPVGSVQGTIKKSYKGRSYFAYEGIPYAKPPIKDLRFEEPQPIEKWEGTLITNKTYMCAQFLPLPGFSGAKGDEDCLYLYIYIPQDKFSPDAKLDVVVHIHGGAFMFGSSKFFARPDFIMDRDVIYVSMTYRLGVLGFLSTQDDVVPGNNGLKDQSLSLKWIKENIQYFGGNPDSITLTGVSAGGASVHYHYLSPKSKGLFHRGFSMSGTVLSPWALTEKSAEKAKFLASKVDCPHEEGSRKLVECLRNLPVKTLVSGITNLFVFKNAIPYTPFGPVVEKGDSGFITKHPYKILQDKEVYDVPWIASNVKDEGIFPAGFFVLFGVLDFLNSNWTFLIPYALDFQDTVDDSEKEELAEKIRVEYFNGKPVTNENIYSLVELFTDRLFLESAEKVLKLHTKAVESPVYYYTFKYIPDEPLPFPMEKGVAHCDDSKLIFPILTTSKTLSKNDENIVDVLTKFVRDYANTGVPMINGVEWKPINSNSEKIDLLEISSAEKISMSSVDHLGRFPFWQNLHIKESQEL